MQDYGIMMASTQISKEGLENQAMCSRVEVPFTSPRKVKNESVRVKSKMH
jgi:hypothetical protein